jgi:hypothetical protein
MYTHFLILLQDDDIMSDLDVPVRVFVTPIDKQIMTYRYSSSSGFATVAATMNSLKHTLLPSRHGSFNESSPASNTIGVNLVEVTKGYSSSESEASGDETIPAQHGNGTHAPKNNHGLVADPRLSFESAAIVVDEELGRELKQQADYEKELLIRPLSLWRRRKRRHELEEKLRIWKEQHNVPDGIGTSRGSSELLKARVIRSLGDSCKSSFLFQYAPSLIAYNLTLKLHYLYSTIPLLEFAVHCGFSVRSRREVPMLARFRSECDKMQELFVSEILCEDDPLARATLIMNLIQVNFEECSIM